MKMPSRAKLIRWYKSLLDIGKGNELIQYSNVASFAKAAGWSMDLQKIPYFYGLLYFQNVLNSR